MKQLNATIIGFLAAPIVPAPGLGISMPVAEYVRPELIPILAFFLFGYLISLIFMVVFGIPAYFLGKRLKLIRWWSGAVVGMIIGCVVKIVLEWPQFENLSSAFTTSAAKGFLLLGTVGALSGFVFWLIWRQGDSRQTG